MELQVLFQPSGWPEAGIATGVAWTLEELVSYEAVQVGYVSVEMVFPLEAGIAVGATVLPTLIRLGVGHHVLFQKLVLEDWDKIQISISVNIFQARAVESFLPKARFICD